MQEGLFIYIDQLVPYIAMTYGGIVSNSEQDAFNLKLPEVAREPLYPQNGTNVQLVMQGVWPRHPGECHRHVTVM